MTSIHPHIQRRTHGHNGPNGPKISYRTREQAQTAADVRGWFKVYACGDHWHIRKWHRGGSAPWWREYGMLNIELHTRATAWLERQNKPSARARRHAIYVCCRSAMSRTHG